MGWGFRCVNARRLLSDCWVLLSRIFEMRKGFGFGLLVDGKVEVFVWE